tara:strand:+ start:1028 stop:2170 length:1143 start_codon:yes stop_codon:yes gene_type:complete
MKKIAIFTTTRSDISILTPLIKKIRETKKINYLLFVGGTHLDKDYGSTKKEILSDKITINGYFNYLVKGDSKKSLSSSLANAHSQINNLFAKYKFDYVCVLGDRFEKMAIVNNAIIYNKPIIHLHGGEITEGVIDNQIRNMISKASHLHFVICEFYKKQLIKMGEKRNRIFNLGSLAIDLIKSVKKMSKVVLFDKIKIKLNIPTVILTYHPVTLEKKISEITQIKNIFDTLKKTNFQIVVTAPGHENGRGIIEDYIKKISFKNKKIVYVKSLGHNLLFNLLPHCKFMIGNSSSGIIEAPFFKIPTINIGDRQKGRFKHASVINCSYSKNSIQKAINLASSIKFKKKILRSKFFFGNGKSSEKILRQILKTQINEKFLRKK